MQRFVLDLDQIHRVESDVFVDGRNRGDRIADEANLVYTERVLVLANRQNAVRNWQIFAGDNCDDPGKRQSFRQVNAPD